MERAVPSPYSSSSASPPSSSPPNSPSSSLSSPSLTNTPPDTTKQPVIWFAPFFSGGGFADEAITYVREINKFGDEFPVSIVNAPFDSKDRSFLAGQPRDVLEDLVMMHRQSFDPKNSVVICHYQPSFYASNNAVSCPPRQPSEYPPRYSISRTMFETNSIPADWPKELEKFQEIWVPTQFHVETYRKAGVPSEKIFKIPEAVDTEYFDPDAANVTPFPLPNYRYGDFVFLSIFKWEVRKGWDILLTSFLKAFTKKDRVCLYILTHGFGSRIPSLENILLDIQANMDGFFDNDVTYSDDTSGEKTRENWPCIRIISQMVAQTSMPALYKSANAFVLPTRGEGWGLPIVEAMSMGLPVIATDWSGPSEYLTTENSFPLPIDGLTLTYSGDFQQTGRTKGHRWASPSVPELVRLMKYVSDPQNKEEIKAKGNQARRDMTEKYCFKCIADIVLKRLRTISKALSRGLKHSHRQTTLEHSHGLSRSQAVIRGEVVSDSDVDDTSTSTSSSLSRTSSRSHSQWGYRSHRLSLIRGDDEREKKEGESEGEGERERERMSEKVDSSSHRFRNVRREERERERDTDSSIPLVERERGEIDDGEREREGEREGEKEIETDDNHLTINTDQKQIEREREERESDHNDLDSTLSIASLPQVDTVSSQYVSTTDGHSPLE